MTENRSANAAQSESDNKSPVNQWLPPFVSQSHDPTIGYSPSPTLIWSCDGIRVEQPDGATFTVGHVTRPSQRQK